MRLIFRSTPGLVVTALLLMASQASAVILYASNTRNTSPPGSLTNIGGNYTPGGPDDPRRLLNSGWQWEGRYSSYLGTVIGSQYFITAQHIGIDFTNLFFYNGSTYNVDTSFGGVGYMNGPNSDLRIFKITGTFPSWAPLYNASTDGSEVGKQFIVFGRSWNRGAEVRVNGELKGWEFGVPVDTQSWGENVVTGVVNGGASLGSLLYFNFDRDGITNECSLVAGDSGGGVFIKSGSTWKLAGINYGTDNPWRYTVGGSSFFANIFDAGGLYVGEPGQFIMDTPEDIPGSSYSTRISTNLAWIQSVVGMSSALPEPAFGLTLLAVASLLARRHPR